MRVIVDGTKIKTTKALIDAVASSMHGDSQSDAYFGFELHSFADCLHGGFIGTPPYEIVVQNAEAMLDAFGYAGMARYCEEMLGIIESGGAGLVQADTRDWYATARQNALAGTGETLLDLLLDTIRTAPASLTLYSRDGKVLAQARGPSGVLGPFP